MADNQNVQDLSEQARIRREKLAALQEAGMDPANPAVSFLIKTWERKAVSNLALTRIQCALAILSCLPEPVLTEVPPPCKSLLQRLIRL